jgi:hypothetical protein
MSFELPPDYHEELVPHGDPSIALPEASSKGPIQLSEQFTRIGNYNEDLEPQDTESIRLTRYYNRLLSNPDLNNPN